jgi:DnaJ-class molecular chaperone
MNEVTIQKKLIKMDKICPICNGDGEILGEECSECQGTGLIRKHFPNKRNIHKTLL